MKTKRIGRISNILFAAILAFGMLIPASTPQGFAQQQAQTCKCELKVTRVLEGGQFEAGQFTFRIEAITKDAPMPEVTTAKNDADGNVSFGEVTYSIMPTDDDKTYEYKVTKVQGDDSGITYDIEPKMLTVTVRAGSGRPGPVPGVDGYTPQSNAEDDGSAKATTSEAAFTNKARGGRDTGDVKISTQVTTHYISPAKNQTVYDEVEIEGLEEDGEYTLVGTLVNKDTGEVLATSSEETTWFYGNYGYTNDGYTFFENFDASDLNEDDELVVFEYLYKGDEAGTPGDGTEIASHEDINDAAQTVTVVDGEITIKKTTDAKNAKDGDIVEYKITVTNSRKVDTWVRIGDWPRLGLDFISASDGGTEEFAHYAIYWDAKIPANGSKTVTIKFKIDGYDYDYEKLSSARNEAVVWEPENWDNPMTRNYDEVVLDISDDPTDKNKDGKTSTSTGESDKGTSTGESDKDTNTGDAVSIGVLVGIMLMALAVASIALIRRRRCDV